MQQIITLKMNKLGIENEKLTRSEEIIKTFSFVLINPSPDFALQANDVVYLLKPGGSIGISESTISFDTESREEKVSTINESFKKNISHRIESKKSISKSQPSNVSFI